MIFFVFKRKCFVAVRPNIPPIRRVKIPKNGMAAILIIHNAPIKEMSIWVQKTKVRSLGEVCKIFPN